MLINLWAVKSSSFVYTLLSFCTGFVEAFVNVLVTQCPSPTCLTDAVKWIFTVHTLLAVTGGVVLKQLRAVVSLLTQWPSVAGLALTSEPRICLFIFYAHTTFSTGVTSAGIWSGYSSRRCNLTAIARITTRTFTSCHRNTRTVGVFSFIHNATTFVKASFIEARICEFFTSGTIEIRWAWAVEIMTIWYAMTSI